MVRVTKGRVQFVGAFGALMALAGACARGAPTKSAPPPASTSAAHAILPLAEDEPLASASASAGLRDPEAAAVEPPERAEPRADDRGTMSAVGSTGVPACDILFRKAEQCSGPAAALVAEQRAKFTRIIAGGDPNARSAAARDCQEKLPQIETVCRAAAVGAGSARVGGAGHSPVAQGPLPPTCQRILRGLDCLASKNPDAKDAAAQAHAQFAELASLGSNVLEEACQGAFNATRQVLAQAGCETPLPAPSPAGSAPPAAPRSSSKPPGTE